MADKELGSGDIVKVIEGSLKGTEAVITRVEQPTRYGRDELAKLIVTKGVISNYGPGREVTLYTYKLESVNLRDPNLSFKRFKSPRDKNRHILFRCGPCGRQSPDPKACPECGRDRVCHACGATDYSPSGKCFNCGTNYKQPY